METPRYDWYQTESHVVITIMLKNAKSEDFHHEISNSNLNISIKLSPERSFNLDFDLAHEIVPDETKYKILSTKIEVKLKKRDEIRWTKLEGDPRDDGQVQHFKPSTDPPTVKYPSSSHYTRDWDKLAADIKKEEETEETQGDAALNAMFQKIYRDGSDEVKRAMNKSFQESGGTVLSTNWKDIGKGKVDVKPPDGMEYKKYEY